MLFTIKYNDEIAQFYAPETGKEHYKELEEKLFILYGIMPKEKSWRFHLSHSGLAMFECGGMFISVCRNDNIYTLTDLPYYTVVHSCRDNDNDAIGELFVGIKEAIAKYKTASKQYSYVQLLDNNDKVIAEHRKR